MRQIIRAKIARAQAENKTAPDFAAKASGLILLDTTLTPIAIDAGAAMILNSARHLDKRHPKSIPSEILDEIKDRKPTELSSLEIQLQLGGKQYVGRTFLVERSAQIDGPSSQSPNQTFVAIHIERKMGHSLNIGGFGDTYNLTKREHETLGHLAKGLTSSEVAREMEISSQTVKAFIRGIMAKMGVSSRGEILAKLLENNSPIPRRLPSSAMKTVRSSVRNE